MGALILDGQTVLPPASTPSVITTRGDLIRGGVGGVAERVGVGTLGQVFTSDGTDAGWAAPAGGGGDSDVYDFSTSTGVLLEAGSIAGSTAVVSGGALVCTATAQTGWASTLGEFPKGSVPLVVSGRTLRSWRARARLVSLTRSDGTATTYDAVHGYLAVLGASGEWAAWYVAANGSGFRDTSVGGGGGVGGAGTYATDGTQWLELEYVRGEGSLIWRHGVGVGSAEPTTWTELTSISMAGVQWSRVYLAGAAEAWNADVQATWDDLTVEAL